MFRLRAVGVDAIGCAEGFKSAQGFEAFELVWIVHWVRFGWPVGYGVEGLGGDDSSNLRRAR